MTGEHIRGIPRTYEKEITLADTPYTLSVGFNCVKVDTTGGNIRVNLPNVNYPIDVIKTSSDSYLVTLYVAGTQIGEVAGELSSVTVESGQITKDEPWYPYDAIVGIAGVSGDGGEVLAKDRFGRVIAGGRGVAGTDDGTVLTSVFASLNSGETLCLMDNLIVSSPIVLLSKNINVFSPNGSSITSTIATDDPMLTFSGTLDAPVALPGDLVAGANIIPVTDSTGFSIGDLVLIYDDTIWGPDYPTYQQGELHRVLAITGNSLVIEDTLIHEYTTTANSKIVLIHPIEVNINGISFIGPEKNSAYKGIQIQYAKNVTFEKNTMQNFGHTSIRFSWVYNLAIIDNTISGCRLPGYGYGIAIDDATAHSETAYNHVYDCRHCIKHGGAGPGQVRDSRVMFNTVSARISEAPYDGTISAAPIDVHPIVESVVIANNTIYNKLLDPLVYSGLSAIVCSARHSLISSNICYNGGITLGGKCGNATSVINSNKIYNACIVKNSNSNQTFTSLSISDNSLEGSLYYPYYLYCAISNLSIRGGTITASDVLYDGIFVNGATGGTISDVVVKNCGHHGISLNNSSNVTISNVNVFNPNRANASGYYGIYLHDSLNNVIKNCRFEDSDRYMRYVIGEHGTSNLNLFLNIFGNGYNYSAAVMTPGVNSMYENLHGSRVYNAGCRGLHHGSGSSTGTGSEQTIAHGLAAIPTGCKAWITYLVGTRYVTEMIPFDATNVYPTVDNGVAYTWRIE